MSVGFNLTKLVSSSKEVMEGIPPNKRTKELQEEVSDQIITSLVKSALGVVWHVGSDTLGFRVQFSEKTPSRRVLLSDISSSYDPDGRGSAFIFPGKRILQEVTAEKEDWDKPLSDSHIKRWNQWKSDMLLLEDLKIPRCYIPIEFGEPVSQSLHCFSDASTVGYGQTTYLRSVNESGEIHVSLVTAKSRVAPMKLSVTVPRLEVTAGTVSVKVGSMVEEELDISDLLPTTYWTDSTIVLG